MELRHYWKILRRRWLLVVIPTAIVLIVALASYRPPAPGYNVGVRFLVGQTPVSGPDSGVINPFEESYYNWLVSEYIVNGLNDWVRSGAFATAVSDYLAAAGYDVPAGAIQGGVAADNARSMLTLSLTHGDADTLALIADGAIAVLTEQNAAALPQLGGENAQLTQLDAPIINPLPAGIRNQLDLPLRVLVAFVVGVGLALLSEYLDPTIRDREEVQRLGLPLLGEIPRK